MAAPPPPTAASALTTPTPSNPLPEIPPLTTLPATTPALLIPALHLISDSVAQQRQLAATSVIFHPLPLALYTVLLALIHQCLYHGAPGDLPIVLTTGAGVTMAALLTVRWMVAGYLARAEQIGTWAWLGAGRNEKEKEEDDTVLVTKFGEELIGVLVLRGVKDAHLASGHAQSGGGGSGKVKTMGVIRAWTVRQKYRHKGVGTALLEDAVRMCRAEKGWAGPIFAVDHANSGRVLLGIFNGGFEKRERRGREVLARLMRDFEEADRVGKGKGGKGRRG